ncbi:MAG: GIY-YIG nuclease family protein [Oscillospiraceae bacterium]
MNYTYMVQCADGSFYTGWTNDIKKRISAHNSGKGAKYTRCRRPVKLVYVEAFPTKSQAMQREYQIKRLSHQEKAVLLASPLNLIHQFMNII